MIGGGCGRKKEFKRVQGNVEGCTKKIVVGRKKGGRKWQKTKNH